MFVNSKLGIAGNNKINIGRDDRIGEPVRAFGRIVVTPQLGLARYVKLARTSPPDQADTRSIAA